MNDPIRALEVAQYVDSTAKQFEQDIMGFIGDPIDEMTLARIEVCIKGFLQSVMQQVDVPQIEWSKIGVCDVASCVRTGHIAFNPYTVALLERVHDAIDQKRYLHSS